MHLPTIIGTFLLSTFASAHFKLNYPTSLGFDDEIEPNAPCGGENIVFADSDTSVSVNGFPVALLTLHPQATFTYRGTLDKQAPFNWTNLVAVSETGTGNLCLPNIKTPASWAGSSGLVQIIGDLPDGTLYQCAAVKFVSGAATTVDINTCNNASAVTATVIPANTTTSPTTTAGTSGTTSSSTTSPSPTNAASSVVGGAFVAGLGAAMVVLAGL